MKTHLNLAAAAFLVLAAPTVVATAVAATQLATPAPMQGCGHGTADPARLQDCLDRMQAMIDQAKQAKTPAERQRLMTDHMAMMRGQMAAMHGMMGPMAGRGRAADPALPPPMQSMQERMDLMQRMMEQMLQQHELMMKPAE